MTIITDLIMRAYARMEDEEGQGLVEYALILALVSIVSILVLQAIGVSIGGVLGEVDAALNL